MAKRLIVNADDFGLTRGINRAVAELHRAGALTSATLMATGAAFDDAVAVARDNPSLGVGCHVVLADGLPVCPPRLIPTLLGPDKIRLRPKLAGLLRDLALGRVDPAEIEREAVAQVGRLQGAGVRVTHLDTHKHTHVWPPAARAVLAAAGRTGVPAVRNPFEPRWSLALGQAPPARALEVRLMRVLSSRFLAQPQLARRPVPARMAQSGMASTGPIRTTDGTIGIAATGSLNAASLSAILGALPEGTWELVCHPGHNDADLDRIETRLRRQRQVEFQALHDRISACSLQLNGPQLIHYGDL